MKRLAPKYLLWAGLAAAALWVLSAIPAQGGPVAALGSAPSPATADVSTQLAPMLAAALGIERLLETAWNFFESVARQLVAELGLGKQWAAYARQQVVTAQNALSAASAAAAPLASDLQTAEDVLFNAQNRLRGALDSDQYKSFKQVLSILVGIALGISIAVTAGIDMFQELSLLKQAGLFGEIITGLIIGTGSAPVHSLIGLLQQTRDALDETANLFNKRAGATVVASAQAPQAEGMGIAAAAIQPLAQPTPAYTFRLARLAHR